MEKGVSLSPYQLYLKMTIFTYLASIKVYDYNAPTMNSEINWGISKESYNSGLCTSQIN
jgi:hypothetical protein